MYLLFAHYSKLCKDCTESLKRENFCWTTEHITTLVSKVRWKVKETLTKMSVRTFHTIFSNISEQSTSLLINV